MNSSAPPEAPTRAGAADADRKEPWLTESADPPAGLLQTEAETSHPAARTAPPASAPDAGRDEVAADSAPEVAPAGSSAAAAESGSRAREAAGRPSSSRPRAEGFEHGREPLTAVLLTNLGTPDAPTKSAVRRYLKEFLSDPRVIEISRLVWLPVLHGVVLRARPADSAARYRSIWTDEGSPLKVWTEKQAAGLEAALRERGHHVMVAAAMRYGSPSIPEVLDALVAAGATRVLVLPAYPQYSAATTASACDAVFGWGRQQRRLPELRFVNGYCDDPDYIGALAETVRRHWAEHGQPQRLLMSFHGMPERTLHLGDPYHCECRKTARLLAETLGLEPSQYQVTFQSRFGRAKWLEPATQPTLVALGKAGVQRVDVICPGFASDCLETLEEIAIEGRKAFLDAGGKKFHYIACLNDDADWIAALGHMAEKHLAGWPTLEAADPHALAQSRARAVALGAAG